jgi:hypothetical protein
MAAAATVVNLAVRSARGLDTLSAPLMLLLLALCAAAGTVGGAAYFATETVRARGGWRKTAVNVATLLVFCAVAIVLLVVVSLTGLLGK